ncbi:MAG TPA: hypothetical protein VIL99_15025 [Ignavibacteria bacterium]
MVKRGEIYLDKNFIYPAGNIDDKYLLIVNKAFQPGNPIFVATATTKFDSEKNKPGCNHRIFSFLLKANEDFFKEDTLLQLFIINYPLTEIYFTKKKQTGDIEFRAIMNNEVINKIMKCINEIKDDITSGYHKYLF